MIPCGRYFPTMPHRPNSPRPAPPKLPRRSHQATLLPPLLEPSHPPCPPLVKHPPLLPPTLHQLFQVEVVCWSASQSRPPPHLLRPQPPLDPLQSPSIPLPWTSSFPLAALLKRSRVDRVKFHLLPLLPKRRPHLKDAVGQVERGHPDCSSYLISVNRCLMHSLRFCSIGKINTIRGLRTELLICESRAAILGRGPTAGFRDLVFTCDNDETRLPNSIIWGMLTTSNSA